MSAANVRDVSRAGNAWRVSSPSASRASFSSADRADAVARAKRIVRNLGGGEVHVHDGAGAVSVIVVSAAGRASTPDLRVR